MNEREQIIQLWFKMWLTQQDLGMDDIFAEDVIYTESWSPKYNNRQVVKHWFNEWNTRGKVMEWKIKQFFHKDNQTVVEWYFKNEMNNGNIEDEKFGIIAKPSTRMMITFAAITISPKLLVSDCTITSKNT